MLAGTCRAQSSQRDVVRHAPINVTLRGMHHASWRCEMQRGARATTWARRHASMPHARLSGGSAPDFHRRGAPPVSTAYHAVGDTMPHGTPRAHQLPIGEESRRRVRRELRILGSHIATMRFVGVRSALRRVAATRRCNASLQHRVAAARRCNASLQHNRLFRVARRSAASRHGWCRVAVQGAGAMAVATRVVRRVARCDVREPIARPVSPTTLTGYSRRHGIGGGALRPACACR